MMFDFALDVSTYRNSQYCILKYREFKVKIVQDYLQDKMFLCPKNQRYE